MKSSIAFENLLYVHKQHTNQLLERADNMAKKKINKKVKATPKVEVEKAAMTLLRTVGECLPMVQTHTKAEESLKNALQDAMDDLSLALVKAL